MQTRSNKAAARKGHGEPRSPLPSNLFPIETSFFARYSQGWAPSSSLVASVTHWRDIRADSFSVHVGRQASDGANASRTRTGSAPRRLPKGRVRQSLCCPCGSRARRGTDKVGTRLFAETETGESSLGNRRGRARPVMVMEGHGRCRLRVLCFYLDICRRRRSEERGRLEAGCAVR